MPQGSTPTQPQDSHGTAPPQPQEIRGTTTEKQQVLKGSTPAQAQGTTPTQPQDPQGTTRTQPHDPQGTTRPQPHDPQGTTRTQLQDPQGTTRTEPQYTTGPTPTQLHNSQDIARTQHHVLKGTIPRQLHEIQGTTPSLPKDSQGNISKQTQDSQRTTPTQLHGLSRQSQEIQGTTPSQQKDSQDFTPTQSQELQGAIAMESQDPQSTIPTQLHGSQGPTPTLSLNSHDSTPRQPQEIQGTATRPPWDSQVTIRAQPQDWHSTTTTQPQVLQSTLPEQSQVLQGTTSTNSQASQGTTHTQRQYSQGTTHAQLQGLQGTAPTQPMNSQNTTLTQPKELQGSTIIQPQDSQGSTTTQPQDSQSTTPAQRRELEAATHMSSQDNATTHRHAICIKQPDILMAQMNWRVSILDWYPNLHRQTYFLPPLFFKRVPYDVQTVVHRPVLIPQEASDQPGQTAVYFPPAGPPPRPSDPPLASGIWPHYQPVPPGPLPVVFDMEIREDHAMQRILHYISDVAEKKQEVMLVISQLEFRKYLDNQVSPIYAAAIRLLPRPADVLCSEQERKVRKQGNVHGGLQGDFDVLMINFRYGLIVGEVKSVGADLSKTPDLEKAVLKAIMRAVKQLNKAETVLKYLVSDLAPIRITKTLMLPNLTSIQLQQALSTNPAVQQALCQFFCTDLAGAVNRCLTEDRFTSCLWWQQAVTVQGPDCNMTPDLYEVLVARFCGPATTVDVPTITIPPRSVGLRTLSEAVALTGVQMSLLTLYPHQMELVNRPGLPRVFLWGPPGTGKTVILVLKSLQWGHQGKSVHLLSSHEKSRAAILLIKHQLLNSSSNLPQNTTPASGTLIQKATPASGTLVRRHAFPRRILSAFRSPKKDGSTASTQRSAPVYASGPRVYTHFYNFSNREDVQAAVKKLGSAARHQELFVIADEAFSGSISEGTSGRFAEFSAQLAARVPALHLWAAAVDHVDTPACLCVEKVTTPVRCPPAVFRVVEGSAFINDVNVPHYSRSATPIATDGPAVRQILHWEDCSHKTLSPGHTKGLPVDCRQCADAIFDLMKELRVGQSGTELQYRDTIILCLHLRKDVPVAIRLRERGLPVEVVRSSDKDAIRDVALAVHNVVTVTNYEMVYGLERRVVVVMGCGDDDDNDRLLSMSRCTSLLVWIGDPLQNFKTESEISD